MKTTGYNIMRDDSALLEEHEKSPPSFSVHLYPDHWTLNNGPKFLYNNPVSSILDDIRAFRIPTDFIPIFDDAGVPYYNGCLIVEILDFRPSKVREPILERPDKQRVVLRPNGETLWADICIMNTKAGSKWSDMNALQVESKLLLSTSTPLCLDPDPSLTRVVNSILRVSTPNIPNSLKRKAAAMVDLEEDETEKAKRAKIMQFMNPQFSPSRTPFLPSYKILTLLEQQRTVNNQRNSQPASNSMTPANASSGTMAPPSVNAGDRASSTVAPQLTTSYSQSNTISQPVPVAAPQTQASAQLQQATDLSQRASPSKQQQASNGVVPQRPSSQASVIPQVNAANQQPQAQGQPPTQPVQFNPPLPPTNFLSSSVPTDRRRSSVAAKPSTPAVSSAPLPAQQPANNQTQPQPQPHLQTQAQIQTQLQAASQALGQTQPQRIPPHMQQQARPPQIPPNMSSFQATQLRNMAQFYQNTGSVPVAQAAVAAQRQNMNGRSTPINSANSSASPAPTSSAIGRSPMLPAAAAAAIGRSPMLPAAAAAAMLSRQNTPVATNTQVARGSPLPGSHPVAARAVAAQSGPQQQSQQPMPGAQPVMVQPGAAMNPALAYQHYQLQNQQRLAFLQAQQRHHQAQMHQQGHMTPAPQQQQQNQQSGAAQSQQTTQAQTPGTQQPFPGVQVPPQAFNYMPMNMSQQQYLWQQQRALGRGMTQVPQNAQQQVPAMPPAMTMQQMQGLGRGGGLPSR